MSKQDEKNVQVENQDDYEEEDDNTPVDPETLKKLTNLTIDQSAFTSDNGSKKKSKKTKQPKTKTNKKGEDFMIYAQSHGIDVKLKYGEKSPEKKEYKDQQQSESKSYQNQDKKPQYKSDNNTQYYNKDKTTYYNNKPKYQNNQTGQNNHQNKPKKNTNYYQEYPQTKTFNNKFDPMNTYFSNPYNFFQMTQMNQMMRPDLMFGMNMPMHQQQNPYINNMGGHVDESHHLVKGIKESLEYYFSLDNLNKDSFIRSKMNSSGYVEAEEILKFNNMKKHNADLEKVREVIKNQNTIVEEAVIEGKIFIRNKSWETIKNHLISIEDLESMKLQKKNHTTNMNYVTMQNNYFMPIMPMDQNMLFQGQNPYMNQMNPYSYKYPFTGGMQSNQDENN